MTLIKSISGFRGTIGGIPDENLTPVDIVKFASAYGAWVLSKDNGKVVIIGRDARISGKIVSDLVVSTLLSMGLDVVNLGLSTTPTVEMAVKLEKAAGGIILTASHNPKQWNALKLLNNLGEFISAAEASKVLEIAEAQLFDYADFKPEKYRFNTLLVSPINLRSTILRLIDAEISNKKSGKEAYVLMKMNSLVDLEIIEKLYTASNAGVRIDLIVRGICCLVPGVKGKSENIHAISIVDKFLEHARIYVFGNAGKELMFMGSADMMTRNLDNRIEVCFPVLSPQVREEVRQMLDIQLSDNCKARVLDAYQINEYKPTGIPRIRSQVEFYNYLKNKYETSISN